MLHLLDSGDRLKVFIKLFSLLFCALDIFPITFFEKTISFRSVQAA